MKSCQISKLFVVVSILTLILIATLPSYMYVLKDAENGTITKIYISKKVKTIIFLGYVLGSILINKLILRYCNRDYVSIILFLTSQLLILFVISLLLILFGVKITRENNEVYL